MTNQLFEKTCEVFDLKTCNNQEALNVKMIDPCSCDKYYQCSNNIKPIHQECAQGTAWDYKTKICQHKQQVEITQPCDKEKNVWTRCNTTESRLKELEYICTNKTTTNMTTISATTVSSNLTSGKVNPGIIIGSIIGGALIAVVVLTAFYLYRRQRKKSSIKRKRSTIAQNPEYFENGHPDDPYAVIHDDHVITDTQMTDPTYIGPSNGGTVTKSNGSCTNAGFEDTEAAVYDNRGERFAELCYTSTLRRSVREYATTAAASSSLVQPQGENVTGNQSDIAGASGQKEGNMYVDLNGNRNKSGNENLPEVIDNDNSTPGELTEHTGGHTNEDSPDYFMLERSGM